MTNEELQCLSPLAQPPARVCPEPPPARARSRVKCIMLENTADRRCVWHPPPPAARYADGPALLCPPHCPFHRPPWQRLPARADPRVRRRSARAGGQQPGREQGWVWGGGREAPSTANHAANQISPNAAGRSNLLELVVLLPQQLLGLLHLLKLALILVLLAHRPLQQLRPPGPGLPAVA